MRSLTSCAVAVGTLLALWALGAGSAVADPIVWELLDVAFDDGAIATGSFTVEGADTLLDWSITVRGGDEAAFPPVAYTRTSSTGEISRGVFVAPGPPPLPPVLTPFGQVSFELPSNRSLSITVVPGLESPGLQPIDFGSELDSPAAVSRITTSGALLGVPEPGTALLVGIGVGVMASRRRRGRR